MQTQHFLLSIDLKLVCKLFGVEINSAFFFCRCCRINYWDLCHTNKWFSRCAGKMCLLNFQSAWTTHSNSQPLFICLKSNHSPGKKVLFLEERLYQVLYCKEYVSSVGLRKQIQVSLKVKVGECVLIMLQKFTESTVSPPSLLWVRLHPFDNTLLSVQPHIEQSCLCLVAGRASPVVGEYCWFLPIEGSDYWPQYNYT